MADPLVNLGKVFVSYSHQDKQWLDRLRTHLKPLEREGVFDIWDDTRIEAGGKWRSEIQKAIKAASVAVLLISSASLASDFITEVELPALRQAAKDRGVTILLVILNPCRFEQTKNLRDLEAVNSPSRTLSEMTQAEQDRVFVHVADQIHAALTRPVLTGLRDKLHEKFREVGRNIESRCREVRTATDLVDKDKEFLEVMWQVSGLDRKLEIVLDEICELDRKCAALLPRGSDAARFDLQREFLQEEMEKLKREKESVRAKMPEENRPPLLNSLLGGFLKSRK